MKMMKTKRDLPTQDVWCFKRDLRKDFETLKLLERHFFELDDICECAIKIDSDIANMLDKQQEQVYDMMTSVADRLSYNLREGRIVLYGMKEDGEV